MSTNQPQKGRTGISDSLFAGDLQEPDWAQIIARSEPELAQLEPATPEWGFSHLQLSVAYRLVGEGNLEANYRAAVQHGAAAQSVFTREEYPREWVLVQLTQAVNHKSLGAYEPESLLVAIDFFQELLQVVNKNQSPIQWARIHENLAGIYQDLPGDESDANLAAAARHQEKCLEVYTRKKYPAEWAACQRELAAISAYMTKGNAVAIYRKAISHLEAALTVHTRAKFPEEWARDKVLMAELVKTSPLSNPQVSGKKAAAHLEEALRVYTEARYPEEWAGVQLKLATLAIGSPREGDPASEARTAGFRRAIELSNAALRVFTREEFPRDWSTTQATLGLAHSELRAGDRALNLTRAIEYFNAADEVIAGDDDPEVWALNQVNMGIAYRRLKDDKTARKHYQAALKVLTPEEYPDGNDLVLEHLDMLEKGVDLDLEPDPEDELKRLNARLNLYPEDKFPEKFAEAHFEMGVIEVDLMDKYDDNRRMHFALKHFESAARAYRTAGCAEEAKSASVLAQNLRAALKQAF